MLNERRAVELVYDAAGDTARLVVDHASAGDVREEPASLLLDSGGLLVGVDVSPDSPRRVVVMLGPHEAVDSTRDARVVVTSSAAGDVAEVRIAGARAACRADRPSPYR